MTTPHPALRATFYGGVHWTPDLTVPQGEGKGYDNPSGPSGQIGEFIKYKFDKFSCAATNFAFSKVSFPLAQGSLQTNEAIRPSDLWGRIA